MRRVTEGHEGDWIRTRKEGSIERHAAVLALRIRWGPNEMVLLRVNLKFTSNDQANRLLRIQGRDGWALWR